MTHQSIRLLSCFLAFGLVGACSGPAGPQGPTGPQGTAGTTGPAGPTNTTFIRTTVASSGDGGATSTVTVGTWGPFTLKGYCLDTGTSTAPTVTGQFYIGSADPGAKLTDYWTQGNNIAFPADGGFLPIADASSSGKELDGGWSSDLEGPYDGTFAAQSSDLTTYITGLLTTGTYMNGSAGPACQFAGYVTQAP